MKLSERGIDELKEFEGQRLQAYRDQGNVWTIGVGHTGPDVKEGMVITEQHSDSLLANDVRVFEQAIEELVLTRRTLKQHQFDALVCLVFNIGAYAFEGSTLRAKLISKDDRGAALEFTRWNKVRGQFNEGLLRRRAAEMYRFLRDD